MGLIKGQEFHDIIYNVFDGDVKGIGESEQLQCNCPRCQERDGLPYPDGKYNLEINTAKRVFRCWKCDEPKFSGSLKRLVRLFGSFSDYELYKSYASINDFEYDHDYESDEPIEVKLPDEMILFSEMNPDNPDHFEAYNYLITERQLSKETIFKYRLGFCVIGKYAGRIIIPSYDTTGNVNYFVGRAYRKNIKQPYKNPKINKNSIIFNEGLINWDSTVYLVEGVFEMFVLINSIPLLGKNISETLFFKLKIFKPNIIVLLDPDAYKSSIDLFYMLHSIYVGHEEKIKIVKLPTEHDLDELKRYKGRDSVIDVLYSARGLTVDDYFIKKLQKPYERERKRYNSYKEYFGG